MKKAGDGVQGTGDRKEKVIGSYVPALKQRYEFRDGKAWFEDGVAYTFEEMLYLSKMRAAGEVLTAIHKVKKLFDGEILTYAGTRSYYGESIGHLSEETIKKYIDDQKNK